MSESTRPATFEELWGALLLVRFHGDGGEFRSFNERRADWIWDLLPPSAPEAPAILDLGCGSGVLDVCLAQRGATVTGVDRIGGVLDIARRLPGTEAITFLHKDLLDLTMPASSLDAVLVLGLVGLMSIDADRELMERSHRWLRPGGRLIVDYPRETTELVNQWSRHVDDDRLDFRSEYGPATRLQHITPTFHRHGDATVTLCDPYDQTKPYAEIDSGILRYVYPAAELMAMLTGAGFIASEVEHLSPLDHYALVGERA